MQTHNRTPEEIERKIEAERARLGQSIDELRERFSPEYFIREVTRSAREHGGEIGESVLNAAKRNPLGLALTGAGIAWLVFGGSKQEKPKQITNRAHERHYPSEARHGGSQAYTAYRGDASTPSQLRRRYPDWAYAYDEDLDSGPGRDWSDRAQSAGREARGFAESAAGTASGAARSAGRSASGAAGSLADTARNAGRRVSEAAGSASARASEIRERLARGTEDLSAEARERVIAARHRAMDAYHRSNAAVRRNWQKGSTAAGSFVDDHPLVAGALAMAVGAAIAGALPRTRYEDETLGSYRDDLFDEAERVFREERRKAEETAEAAIDEAGKIAQEKIRSVKTAAVGDKPVAEGLKDEAKTAGKRVAGAAASEADKQELGKATS